MPCLGLENGGGRVKSFVSEPDMKEGVRVWARLSFRSPAVKEKEKKKNQPL